MTQEEVKNYLGLGPNKWITHEEIVGAIITKMQAIEARLAILENESFVVERMVDGAVDDIMEGGENGA